MYFYYFPFDLFLEIGHKLDNFFRWLKKNCFWDFLTFSQKFDSQFQLRQKGKIKSFSIFEIKRHGITTLNQCDMSTTSTCFLRGQSSLIFIRSSSILFNRSTCFLRGQSSLISIDFSSILFTYQTYFIISKNEGFSCNNCLEKF